MSPTLWRYRRFIWVNSLAELRHRFSGSVAGYLWNVFIPLAQITVFAVVFGVLMHYSLDVSAVGPKGPLSFIVFLCSGLLPWNAFADTLVRGSGSLVGNAGYLRKLAIPEQIFVAKEACAGLLSTVLTLIIFAIFSAVAAGWGPYWTWLQAIPLLALFIAFAYGLGLILACLNVFFRDIQPLMGVVMLLWMWLTPVVYKEELLKDSPLAMRLMPLNPAYHFIHGFHESFLKAAWISPGDWAVCIGLAVGVNLVAWPVLARLRAEIRDVL